MKARATVELITRPRCSLCDEARAVLARWSPRLGVEVVEVDVDDRSDLAGLSGRIPVVRTVGGRVIDDGRVSALRVVAGLAAVRLAGPGGRYNRER